MDLDKSQESECGLCHGTGTLAWQQPNQDASIFRTIEMPCPNGCGGTWRYPAAERDRVVDEPSDPDRPDHVRGQADEADEIGAGFIQAALRGWGWDADDEGRWHRQEP